MVPRTGLEPACLSTHAPETCASTIPPPGHYGLSTFAQQTLERKTRLELATLTLARLCSTNWAISALFLQPFIIFPIASAKVVLFSKLPKLSTIFFWKKWQISLASQAPLRYLPTLFPIKTPCKWTFRKALRTVSKSIFQQPKKHKDIWLKTYLRFKSNVLVFWLKRTCVWIKTLRPFFTNT